MPLYFRRNRRATTTRKHKNIPYIHIRKWVFILFSAFALVFLSCPAEASQTNMFILAGGGRSHTGWGDTKQEISTFDLVLRLERPISQERGRGWYHNEHVLWIDLPVHILRESDQPPMFGASFQACWIFIANLTVNPYIFAGGGPVLTQAEIPGTSSVIRGAYNFGAGLRLNVGVFQLSLEARYHHISNGGIKKPNDPLNSHKILFGIKLNK